jgi:hypothetical protein
MAEREIVTSLQSQGWVTEEEAATICGLKSGSNVKRKLEAAGVTRKVIPRQGTVRPGRRMYWRGDLGMVPMKGIAVPQKQVAELPKFTEPVPAAAEQPAQPASPDPGSPVPVPSPEIPTVPAQIEFLDQFLLVFQKIVAEMTELKATWRNYNGC